MSRLAVGLSLLCSVGFGCSNELEEFQFAEIDPLCAEGMGEIRVAGTIGETSVAFAETSFGYSALPIWSLKLFEPGAEFTLVPENDQYAGTMPAFGVFRLEDEAPLYCGSEGTMVAITSDDTTVFSLRSLAELGSCPGTEVVSGEIVGCVGEEGCTVSGGPLPSVGLGVSGFSFVGAPSQFELQIRLPDGQAIDVSTARNGGSMIYDGVLYCIGSISVTEGDGRQDIELGNLSVLGNCSNQAPVEGAIDVCLPF